MKRYGSLLCLATDTAGSGFQSRFRKRGFRTFLPTGPSLILYRGHCAAGECRHGASARHSTSEKSAYGLERRTGRGTGRDIIDHAPGAHDDVANAAAGAFIAVGFADRYGKSDIKPSVPEGKSGASA